MANAPEAETPNSNPPSFTEVPNPNFQNPFLELGTWSLSLFLLITFPKQLDPQFYWFVTYPFCRCESPSKTIPRKTQ
jgi:hypothetical protein